MPKLLEAAKIIEAAQLFPGRYEICGGGENLLFAFVYYRKLVKQAVDLSQLTNLKSIF